MTWIVFQARDFLLITVSLFFENRHEWGILADRLDEGTATRIAQEDEGFDKFPGGVKVRKTRILIADPRRLFAETLGRVLDSEHDLHVTGYALDGLEALHLVHERTPDVLILGGWLPKYDAPDLVRELSGSGGKPRFLLLSEESALHRLADLYESGIHGCVLMTSGTEELLKAVRCVARGDSGFDARITGGLPDILLRARSEVEVFDDLTPREREVVYWIGQGFDNSKVAETMVLSEKTVKNHVGHILKKLELRDRTQIAVLAWSTGLAAKAPDQIRKNQTG